MWTKKTGLGLLAAALLATLAEAPAADRDKGGKKEQKGGEAPAARPEKKNNGGPPPSPPRENRPPRVEAPKPPRIEVPRPEPRREAPRPVTPPPQNNPAPAPRRERVERQPQQPPVVRSNPAPEAPKAPPAAPPQVRTRPNAGEGGYPLERFRPKNDPAAIGSGAPGGNPAGAGNPFDRFRNRGDAAGAAPAVKPPVAGNPDAGRPAGNNNGNPFDRLRPRGDAAAAPAVVPGAPPANGNPGVNPGAGNPFDRFRNRGDAAGTAPAGKPPVAGNQDAGRPAGNNNGNPFDRLRPRGDAAGTPATIPGTPSVGNGNTGINPNAGNPLDRFRPRGDAAGTPPAGQPATSGGNMIGNDSPFDRLRPRGDAAATPNAGRPGEVQPNPNRENPLDRFRPKGESAGTPGARPGGNGDGRPGVNPLPGVDRNLADAARRASEKSAQVVGRPVNPLSFFKRPGDHNHGTGDGNNPGGQGRPSTRPVIIGGHDHDRHDRDRHDGPGRGPGHDHDHGPNRPGSNTGVVGRPGIGIGVGPGGITIGVGGNNRPGFDHNHNHGNHNYGPNNNYGRDPHYAHSHRPAWAGDGRYSWNNHWHDHGVAHHHHHWHHGSWGGNGRVSYYPVLWSAGWGWGWGWGSLGLNSGYYRYSNPYYVPTQTVVYNYSQPVQVRYIVTEQEGPAPQPTSAEEAGYALFDQARGAFRAQDFQTAQALLDKAAVALPGDAVVHEMRALNLFAMGRYPESAAVLNSLLSAAPGWDWATMIGLYASPDVYTGQLRALEDFRRANQQDAASRFVLAYHYLVQGHSEAAQSELRRVLLLQPDDRVAAQMLQALTAPPEQAPAEDGSFAAQGQPAGPVGAVAPTASVAATAPQAQAPATIQVPTEAPAVAVPANPNPAALAGAAEPVQGPALAGPTLAEPGLEVQASRPSGGTEPAPGATPSAAGAPTTDLVGKWTGVREGATFDFSLSDDGKFAWKAQPEKPAPGQNYPELTGAYSVDQNVIVMEDGQGGTMVGKLASVGKDQFVFTMLGAPEDDPGIAFRRKD